MIQMTKESLIGIDSKLIFRETFNSEIDTRKNGGALTDVNFSDGKGTFNGTSSFIEYPHVDLPSKFTFRFKIKTMILGSLMALSSANTYEIYFNSLKKLSFYNGSSSVFTSMTFEDYTKYEIVCAYDGTNMNFYVDGFLSSSSAISFPNTDIGSLFIGQYYTGGERFKGDMDLVEIYSGALTASEVKNLYESKTYREISGMGGQEQGNNMISGWINNPMYPYDTFITNGADITSAIGDGSGLAEGCYNDITYNFTSGERYKLEFNFNLNSGELPDFRIYHNYEAGGLVLSTIYTAVNGFNSTVLDIIDTYDGRLTIFNGNATNFSIHNLRLKKLATKTLIDFDCRNGAIEDKQIGSIVGDEVVIGGNPFVAGSWALDAGISISNNQLVYTSAAVDAKAVNNATVVVGKKYKVIYKVSNYSSGSVAIRLGTAWGASNFANGIYIETIVATTSTQIRFYSAQSNTTLKIDFVIIKEIRDDFDITDTTIFKDNCYSAKFNGTTSKIDTGTDMIGTKAVTVMGWIKPYSLGESNMGFILDNDKFRLRFTSNNRIIFYSEGNGTYAITLNYAVSLNQWQFVSVTRKSDGIVNFYIGDLDTSPALSGSADQPSGTPVAGTSNVIIGNNNIQTRTFDGLISKLKVVEGILSLAEITQEWSSTKGSIR